MNPNLNSETQSFKLKIRPNNQGQFEVLVSPEATVFDLKKIIESHCSIPASQQRLITQGKLLRDDLKLNSYKLSEGHVVQLSSQPLNLLEGDPQDPNANRRERYREINQSERFETIHQSLQTVDLMFDILNPRVEDEIIGFDNRQRRFFVGQWVDVLDTVEQWLEAQVTDIYLTDQSSQVYIHYSGWPSQWDEWIDTSSQRIQPFHSYTNQSITSPMHSPYPTNPIDDERLRLQGPYNPYLFLQQGSTILSKMKIMLERYYNFNMLHKYEKIGEKVTELRNRLNISHAEESKDWNSDNESADYFMGNEDKDSVESVEIASNENGMSTETELSLLTVQTAPLLDRTGRLLTDLATLIPDPSPSLMPSPAELSQLTTSGRNDMGIHVYALVTPRRNN